jgi:signal transduction histidine kinase/CheY-like chemotaxis protein
MADEATYRRLLDSIGAGFCIIEVLFDAAQRPVDFRYVETNTAFERNTGLHDAAGRRARELTPQLEQDWFDVYGAIALQGEATRFELPAEALGHWYEVHAFRVGHPEQRRVAMVYVDITARVVSEGALRDSERRLRTLAADSARLLEAERVARSEADHAMRAKDDFLATLSHELRTPLSNIVSWSRLLQTQFAKDEAMLRKGLAIISDNALAQGRLLSSLLDISRIVSGKFELELAPLDLNDLLTSVHASMVPAAESRGVSLTWEPAAQGARLLADGARLRQVVENLLSNAIKFTPAGGTVALCCRAGAEGCEMEVRDTGEGIDPAMRPHIFDRFRQADSARSRGHGGLGLGLSIARQIVEMHGGSIAAHSEGRGHGARFTVTLPARQAGTVAPVSRDDEPSAASLHALEGVRVLAVEDQPDMRDLLKRILEDHKARVTVADSAAEALALLRQAPAEQCFDVLISDIGLPTLDGNQFIRIVRHDLQLDPRRLPAVAVTAYAREEDRQRALAAGYQEHVTKPYSVSTLIALIQGLAGRRSG